MAGSCQIGTVKFGSTSGTVGLADQDLDMVRFRAVSGT
jgi:hypothetical protein